MQFEFKFHVVDPSTGQPVEAKSITEEYTIGFPMTPQFAITQNGVLVILKPGGHYGQPALHSQIVLTGEQQ